jgi:integrase
MPDRIRLYDLRHSCASLLLAAGKHPKIVQERLGHASNEPGEIQLTLDTYSHLVPGLQLRAAEKLETLLARPQSVVATPAG